MIVRRRILRPRGPWLVMTIVATWPVPGFASQHPAVSSPSSKVMTIALLPFDQNGARMMVPTHSFTKSSGRSENELVVLGVSELARVQAPRGSAVHVVALVGNHV